MEEVLVITVHQKACQQTYVALRTGQVVTDILLHPGQCKDISALLHWDVVKFRSVFQSSNLIGWVRAH